MSDSTSHLDLISASQSQKEVTANALLDNASPAIVYGVRPGTTALLDWGYYGGRFNGFEISNGVMALTASATNYLVADIATGAISVSTASTNWDDFVNFFRLYKVVTGPTSISSYEDHRTMLTATYASFPYDVIVYVSSMPTASQTLVKYKLTRAVDFNADFAGSTSADADVAATTTATFSIKKNGTEVGTATYAAAGLAATFASTGGTAVSFAAGDVLSIVAPSPADSTLSGISIDLKGMRS